MKAKMIAFKHKETGVYFALTLNEDMTMTEETKEQQYLTRDEYNKDMKMVLDILNMQKELMDSLQRQLNIIYPTKETGLLDLHKVALGGELPEGASKTGEGEDEPDLDPTERYYGDQND